MLAAHAALGPRFECLQRTRRAHAALDDAQQHDRRERVGHDVARERHELHEHSVRQQQADSLGAPVVARVDARLTTGGEGWHAHVRRRGRWHAHVRRRGRWQRRRGRWHAHVRRRG
eukprot:6684720-Prymnesium_polylepis.1